MSQLFRLPSAVPRDPAIDAWIEASDERQAQFQAAEAKMHDDPRMDAGGEPPFDARRLILGCFAPMMAMGRG